ncbi:MAG TPA: MarR family transcriptional regulator [Solirubrobacteraceae bacterium]|nr:MarR family transcriptional regulator [Solirubrobacteraceae bacterium]
MSLIETSATGERAQAIDEVASGLVPAAALLTRLLIRRVTPGISRSEAGLLSALSAGPRRITELAELEGHAQPTVTLLIKRMEGRGWVARQRDPEDGRVVVVSLTAAGVAAIEEMRASYRAALRNHLASMEDADVAALTAATSALRMLIDALQKGPAR